MQVTAVVRGPEPGTRTVELPDGSTAEGLLEKLGIHPGTVLVVRGRAPIAREETLADGETVTVLYVISGGSARGRNPYVGAGGGPCRA
ncbi:MAG: MoaD/ThiS family protein [Methanobacteriota archaeon]